MWVAAGKLHPIDEKTLNNKTCSNLQAVCAGPHSCHSILWSITRMLDVQFPSKRKREDCRGG